MSSLRVVTSDWVGGTVARVSVGAACGARGAMSDASATAERTRSGRAVTRASGFGSGRRRVLDGAGEYRARRLAPNRIATILGTSASIQRPMQTPLLLEL